MTTIDFDSLRPVQVRAGIMVVPMTTASYVKLWRHAPSLTDSGKVAAPRGSLLTERFPREDWPGLYKMARAGFFPWPVDAEPDLSPYPGMTKVHLDSRQNVLKAWRYYTEKFGAQEPQEPQNKAVKPPKAAAAIYQCDQCSYTAKGRTPNMRAHALRLHVTKRHGAAATAPVATTVRDADEPPQTVPEEN